MDLVGLFEPDIQENKYMMAFINEVTRFKSVVGIKKQRRRSRAT